jgi:aspartate--ammonia ligase
MSNLYIPKNYKSHLSLRQTQYAIKKVKDFFEKDLSIQLNLIRVSAPLFVEPTSGLNDDLNGVERAVRFDLLSGTELEIVHSLAKWKRYALKQYGFDIGEGAGPCGGTVFGQVFDLMGQAVDFAGGIYAENDIL